MVLCGPRALLALCPLFALGGACLKLLRVARLSASLERFRLGIARFLLAPPSPTRALGASLSHCDAQAFEVFYASNYGLRRTSQLLFFSGEEVP